MIDRPSVGSNIRAARLGFKWSERHGAFIRMSTPSKDRTLIELAPRDGVPTRKCKGEVGDFRVLWETPQILDMLPWLRGIRRVKKFISVNVDDNGNILEAGT
jgi:hypothetical protein